jgi:hypothetical protein
LAEIPEEDIDLGENPDNVRREIFEEAVLMTHWMHVLSHVLYDTDRWAEEKENPADVKKVNDILEKSSKLLCELIINVDEYPEDLEHGFADINYGLELEYPRRSHGKIQRDTFSFELPGSTALPALVLNPNIPIWSEETTNIKENVANQLDSRKEDMKKFYEGDDWYLHEFSAPLVGITYLESINQSIMAIIKHFIQTGEIPNIGDMRKRGETTLEDTEDSLAIFRKYAVTNGSSESPTIKDYSKVGVKNVGEDNINKVNELIANSEKIKDVNRIQGIVDDVTVRGNSSPNSPADSTIVQTAVWVDKKISMASTYLNSIWVRLRDNSQFLLLPLLVGSLGGYLYSSISAWSDVQVILLALIAAFISSVTAYEILNKWIENRKLLVMSSTLPLIIIISSSSISTSLSSDITIIAGFTVQTIAIITNIIVSSSVDQ